MNLNKNVKLFQKVLAFLANKSCSLLFKLARMVNDPYTKNGTHNG